MMASHPGLALQAPGYDSLFPAFVVPSFYQTVENTAGGEGLGMKLGKCPSMPQSKTGGRAGEQAFYSRKLQCIYMLLVHCSISMYGDATR